MSGRQSRRKGYKFERDVARYLSDVWGISVTTTRNMRGGLQSISGDLAHKVTATEYVRPLGWSIECKDRGVSSVPAWMAQAEESAGDDKFVVIHKQRNAPLIDARCWVEPAMWVWLIRSSAMVPDGPRWLPLDAWAALADGPDGREEGAA